MAQATKQPDGATQPRFSVQTIGPDTAHALLRGKVSNRKINARRVANLAAAMRAGRWEMNGETIKISASGKLQDGQHRLCAVISSGMDVPFMVIEGVPDAAIDTIDTGKPRRGVDVVTMSGYKHPYALTIGANTMWRLLTNAPLQAVVQPSYALETIQRWPNLEYWADRYGTAKGNLAGIISAAALVPALVYLDAIAGRKDLAESLFQGLETGQGLFDGDPILTLRNRLIAMRGKEPRRDVAAIWPGVVRTVEYLEEGASGVHRLFFSRDAYVRQPEKFAEHAVKLSPHDLLADLPAAIETGRELSIADRYTSENTKRNVIAQAKAAREVKAEKAVKNGANGKTKAA